MSKSKIEWTERTWNPIIGCSKVSAGCKNCYAIRQAYMRSFNPNPKISERFVGTVEKTNGNKLNWTGKINYIHSALDIPLQVKKPSMFFVNSMSDLFHPNVNMNFIAKVFRVIEHCPQHTFQILTKHPDKIDVFANYYYYLSDSEIPNNAWIGVSTEDHQTALERIPILINSAAKIKFISAEPLLGSIELDKIPHYKKLDWVIVGGESGPNARPMNKDWAIKLRDTCKAANIPFFFKQWGEYAPRVSKELSKNILISDDGRVIKADNSIIPKGNYTWMSKVGKKQAGRVLDGKIYDEMPVVK